MCKTGDMVYYRDTKTIFLFVKITHSGANRRTGRLGWGLDRRIKIIFHLIQECDIIITTQNVTAEL